MSIGCDACASDESSAGSPVDASRASTRSCAVSGDGLGNWAVCRLEGCTAAAPLWTRRMRGLVFAAVTADVGRTFTAPAFPTALDADEFAMRCCQATFARCWPMCIPMANEAATVAPAAATAAI